MIQGTFFTVLVAFLINAIKDVMILMLPLAVVFLMLEYSTERLRIARKGSKALVDFHATQWEAGSLRINVATEPLIPDFDAPRRV